MANFASSATTDGARKHAWTKIHLIYPHLPSISISLVLVLTLPVSVTLSMYTVIVMARCALTVLTIVSYYI